MALTKKRFFQVILYRPTVAPIIEREIDMNHWTEVEYRDHQDMSITKVELTAADGETVMVFPTFRDAQKWAVQFAKNQIAEAMVLERNVKEQTKAVKVEL